MSKYDEIRLLKVKYHADRSYWAIETGTEASYLAKWRTSTGVDLHFAMVGGQFPKQERRTAALWMRQGCPLLSYQPSTLDGLRQAPLDG